MLKVELQRLSPLLTPPTSTQPSRVTMYFPNKSHLGNRAYLGINEASLVAVSVRHLAVSYEQALWNTNWEPAAFPLLKQREETLSERRICWRNPRQGWQKAYSSEDGSTSRMNLFNQKQLLIEEMQSIQLQLRGRWSKLEQILLETQNG